MNTIGLEGAFETFLASLSRCNLELHSRFVEKEVLHGVLFSAPGSSRLRRKFFCVRSSSPAFRALRALPPERVDRRDLQRGGPIPNCSEV